MNKSSESHTATAGPTSKRQFQMHMTKCLLGNKMLGSPDGIIGRKLTELDIKLAREALREAVDANDARAMILALGSYRLQDIDLESISGDALIAVLKDDTLNEQEQRKILKILLEEKDAKPNFTGDTEESPIHIAALQGNIEALYMLLRFGASVNVKDENGITPIFGAAWCGSVEIMKILLSSKAEVQVSDNSGSTPLHVAAMKGNAEIVKMLIDAGANANAVGSVLTYDDTPLHLAAWCGNIETINHLIKAGAELDAMDYNNNTPLKIAESKGHSEAAELLKSASVV